MKPLQIVILNVALTIAVAAWTTVLILPHLNLSLKADCGPHQAGTVNVVGGVGNE